MPIPVTESRTSRSFVVVWFPPGKPRRQVKKLTLEDAQAYIDDNELMGCAPLIEERETTITERSSVVWNSADSMPQQGRVTE